MLQNYFCSNTVGLLEMYLGKTVNFRCHLFNDHILILGSFNGVNIAIKLLCLGDNKYKLDINYYFGISHRNIVLNNKSLDICLDDLEKELSNLSKRLLKYRSKYGGMRV